MTTAIETREFGTSDYVTEIQVRKEVRWGGFRAAIRVAPNGDPMADATIFVAAERWTGTQPRLILNSGDPGYRDWKTLLDEAPDAPVTWRVVGAARASRGDNQWLTHGPSPLLGSR
jgi:hypothetical protein